MKNRDDIIFVILKKYNYLIIINKILRIKYFNNINFFTIYIAIIIVVIFTTIFSYILYFD